MPVCCDKAADPHVASAHLLLPVSRIVRSLAGFFANAGKSWIVCRSMQCKSKHASKDTWTHEHRDNMMMRMTIRILSTAAHACAG